MNFQPVLAFASQHKEGLGLFALAMAVTMRPKLPWPFVLLDPVEWLYEWFHDGILTFVSMRGPARSEVSVEKKVDTTVTKDEAGKILTASSTSITSGSTAETPQEKKQ